MKKKINCTLLIDDDLVSNYISEKSIRNSNISNEIKVIPNGEVALAYIEECPLFDDPPPELIFLDVNMPGMDGFEFLSTYMGMPDKTRSTVIALTSSVHPDDIEKLYQLGIADYINKPLTPEKLTQIMKKHFGW